MLVGFATASSLEQILAAIARVEQKVKETAARWEVRLVEGLTAVMADTGEREERLLARLLADAEEREKRLAEAPSHGRDCVRIDVVIL